MKTGESDVHYPSLDLVSRNVANQVKHGKNPCHPVSDRYQSVVIKIGRNTASLWLQPGKEICENRLGVFLPCMLTDCIRVLCLHKLVPTYDHYKCDGLKLMPL